MNFGFCEVFGFCCFMMFFVFVGEFFCIFDYFIDIVIGEIFGCLNLDLLFFVGCFVFCGDVDDIIGIDIECYFDLWYFFGSGGNVDKVELIQYFIVGGYFVFVLEYMDCYSILIVFSGRKDL